MVIRGKVRGRVINKIDDDRWQSLKPLWAFIILVLIVLGAIYSGLGTATEAASVGAFGALIITLLMRRLKWEDIGKSCVSTVRDW